jgi:hypothetical protein
MPCSGTSASAGKSAAAVRTAFAAFIILNIRILLEESQGTIAADCEAVANCKASDDRLLLSIKSRSSSSGF